MEQSVCSIQNTGQAMCVTEQNVRTLTAQFAGRGLTFSAGREYERQEIADRQMMKYQPDAYRLSNMTEDELHNSWRAGKLYMNGNDLVRYIEDCRKRRWEKMKSGEVSVINEIETISEQTVCIPQQALEKRTEKVGGKLKTNLQTVVGSFYNSPVEKPIKEKPKRKFRLSTLASGAAVVMSLLLMVSGNLLVSNAEDRVGSMQQEVNLLSHEVNSVRQELIENSDWSEFQQIALQEYGMYQDFDGNSDFLQLQNDTVESFSPESDSNIGLSALLSAFGIKR